MTIHTELLRWDYPALLGILVGITGLMAGYRRWCLSQGRAWSSSGWLETGASLFSVLGAVFLLRAFLWEPFRIPSGSMEPSLLTGDFILVNKYIYGVRLPFVNTVIWPVGKPDRGDVLVFHYPVNVQEDFIKRVVGLPGDHVRYADHVLTINGQVVAKQPAGSGVYWDQRTQPHPMKHFTEQLPRQDGQAWTHAIYERERPLTQKPAPVTDVVVPEGHYFVLGDNRDDSGDSRFWGFVPEAYVMGKASVVWLSWDKRSWKPRWGRFGWIDHGLSGGS